MTGDLPLRTGVDPLLPVATGSYREAQFSATALSLRGRCHTAELKLLRNTRPFNVWGLPAISVPCGFTQSGLPIGLQIAGPPWREDLVLQLAFAYEQATAWHKRNYPLS